MLLNLSFRYTGTDTRGGSLEHLSLDVEENFIDTFESGDVCVP
jgi:hypothetical protein